MVMQADRFLNRPLKKLPLVVVNSVLLIQCWVWFANILFRFFFCLCAHKWNLTVAVSETLSPRGPLWDGWGGPYLCGFPTTVIVLGNSCCDCQGYEGWNVRDMLLFVLGGHRRPSRGADT